MGNILKTEFVSENGISLFHRENSHELADLSRILREIHMVTVLWMWDYHGLPDWVIQELSLWNITIPGKTHENLTGPCSIVMFNLQRVLLKCPPTGTLDKLQCQLRQKECQLECDYV